MTQHAIGPYFIRLDYYSQYGLHSANYPTVTPTPSNTAFSGYTLPDFKVSPTQTDIGTLMDSWVDILKPFFHAQTHFAGWTLFQKANPTDAALPLAQGVLSGVGSNNTSSWTQAVQMTATFRTAAFNKFKIVLMDTQNENDFTRVSSVPGTGRVRDLSLFVTNAGWMVGRDGAGVQTFVSAAWTLNKKLRRAYRMS